MRERAREGEEEGGRERLLYGDGRGKDGRISKVLKIQEVDFSSQARPGTRFLVGR